MELYVDFEITQPQAAVLMYPRTHFCEFGGEITHSPCIYNYICAAQSCHTLKTYCFRLIHRRDSYEYNIYVDTIYIYIDRKLEKFVSLFVY